ncbi:MULTISPECIES: IS21-like element helper ATPase IstB [Sphingobacterium]|jgi:DNA replication protein DnaC|uniref:IS21-like element helper ATPase IstB n=5 Tax=Sphingobacterium TaxID=28453 RepID=A0ACD5C235_9SPHI|nr:IS21-like element helper ATPase IstB [Sphingobacterium sp.]
MNIEKHLKMLRLNGMEQHWRAMKETRQHGTLNFEQGLEMLLQSEVDDRESKRYDRLKKNAAFRYQASIEEINMDATRGIDHSLITDLATGGYMEKAEPIIITGAAGCGKSFMASAFGLKACAQGKRVAYYNLQKLLQRSKMARLEGSLQKLMDRLAKTDLLILDDFGIVRLEQQQRLDLMEIFEDRHGRKATIIASQLPVASWYDIIGEDTIADAILDRIVHVSHRIELKGYDNNMDM